LARQFKNQMGKNLNINRRGFLKASALGTAGALVGSTALGNTNNQNRELSIIRRQLGKTDIELPIVSFGVMRADNASLVKSAFDMGFVHFDTAHGYQEGRNETMLGELFKSVPRDKFVIATKVGADGVDRETGEPGEGTTKEGILEKVELSLNRLQLKYVDILYLHGVSNRNLAFAPQILEAFSELKKLGKIRYAGMSTHRNEPDVIQAAIDSDFYNVVLTSINFKHGMADLIKEKAALAANKGIGMVAMKTMAGGFMDKERQHPINCSAALKWVLQDTNFHTSIPGIVSYDQLMQNFSVMENLVFTEEEKANLEEAKLVAGLYCDGCNECLAQCKKHLPVNEFMRAYMYTYGYRHYENAYSVLEAIGSSANPCKDCTDCRVNCPKGFQISERIADVSRLSDIPKELLV
jgi:predicted aldo/keto reductase-like oxidoreductase